ncbi:hypothetical protein [Pseudomonas sp. LP_7_YM]|uniref:hypothetical protein n=1 Tax=Pseudomonas sp. LP_7_YM TaxID=2485137 RepID=UPI00105C14BA|nr:hypothetical protein [Pseudomonas sp. LP_7_YM]
MNAEQSVHALLNEADKALSGPRRKAAPRRWWLANASVRAPGLFLVFRVEAAQVTRRLVGHERCCGLYVTPG